MAERGVDVYAVAPGYTTDLRREVRDLGGIPVDCSMERAGRNPVRDGLDFLRLAALLRRLQVDATFTYFAKPVLYGTFAARLIGVRRRYALIAGAGYVLGELGNGSPPGLSGSVLRRSAEGAYQVALSGAAAVFVQNAADEARFLEAGIARQSRLVRLPGTGVELERFRPTPPAARPVTFVLVARLLAKKGIREYVEAARIVRASAPDTRFLLLGGTDPNPDSLSREEARSWVEEGLIEWPGWVDDVRGWLARASVFVLPSYYGEGVPRSTQEAMAMGRPVITTDAPGCRDTVIEGENGFLVPARDPEALAQAMLRFVRSPDLIPEMGAASRRLAERRFDVHKVNRLILDAMGL